MKSWTNLYDSVPSFTRPSEPLYKDKKRPGSPTSGSRVTTSFLASISPFRLRKTVKIRRMWSNKFGKVIFLATVALTFIYAPFTTGHGSRAKELTNSFEGYKHYGTSCNVSSLDLHAPAGPVCSDRASLLAAMSGGGRIGKDSPYVPRGCDMQWFTTEEVCEILGRFSQVTLVGDSMLRHVIGAINILIREDLGYGGVTDWNFSEEEKRACYCNNQFDVRDCSVQGIFSTADVSKNDPQSLICPKILPEWSTELRIEQIVRYPIPGEERSRLERSIDTKPSQRRAFVLGHGLWNDLQLDESRAWLDAVLGILERRLRLRARPPFPSQRGGAAKNLPVLLLTPNAAGDKKPDEWLVSQGNKALVRFEHAMAAEAARRSIDHLGTWNMSIQATLYDGVHMDMRGNLVKAMMVLNWLNLLET
ncbi:hypothetical protein F4778DRAFT_773415 [Xylariomycetidae sp. FL2044]|nr:hypothetical protein F4778DRAFT_773415 [Xylariomycetidae sp. FL2044]